MKGIIMISKIFLILILLIGIAACQSPQDTIQFSWEHPVDSMNVDHYELIWDIEADSLHLDPRIDPVASVIIDGKMKYHDEILPMDNRYMKARLVTVNIYGERNGIESNVLKLIPESMARNLVIFK